MNIFLYTGFIETFVVPTAGTWSIDAFGGQGGEASGGDGGLAAQAAGDFAFNAGQVLDIVVGGQGLDRRLRLADGGGGGGGTFVFAASGVPEPSTWVLMAMGFADLASPGVAA